MTNLPFEFHNEARMEMLSGAEYYERQRNGLGSEFLAAVRSAINRAAENPEGCSVEWVSGRGTQVRMRIVASFPFQLYFQKRRNQIQILAVAHEKREPGYWIDRV